MPIELTAAEPTRAHGLAFAKGLEIATEGLFRLMVGGSYEEMLATAFQEPGHDLSYESVTFAVDGGEIVGMVNAFTSDQHATSSTRPLTQAAGWRSLRMGAFVLLGFQLFRFLEDIPDGDLYVQALAVMEDHRGQGIGSMLLEHAERQARTAGSARLSLHVDVKNAGAMRLYERRGLTVEATSSKARLIGGEQAHRMAKPLT